MAAILPFDEINRLAMQGKHRSMDVDRFFDEMNLTDEEKENRKEFSRRLKNDLFIVLSFLFIALQYNIENGIQIAKDMTEAMLLSAIRMFFFPNSVLLAHAAKFADDFIESTLRNQGTVLSAKSSDDVKGAYYFSEDRARLNAENEANAVFNYQQFTDMAKARKTYKQWDTMKDEHVRRSHAKLDGTIIPIDELFNVGNAQMRFPCDWEFAGDYLEELIGCRCTLTYYTDEEIEELI